MGRKLVTVKDLEGALIKNNHVLKKIYNKLQNASFQCSDILKLLADKNETPEKKAADAAEAIISLKQNIIAYRQDVLVAKAISDLIRQSLEKVKSVPEVWAILELSGIMSCEIKDEDNN